ncbi:2'-5' RNA ligase family protein, partial [uncultured Corynebacterium sp.]|uniref:2'-5' RNA ligase family protein n=1 Tax=uncultured Corynebacterium sp. TaxID=159447 RepID=UPI00345BD6F5
RRSGGRRPAGVGGAGGRRGQGRGDHSRGGRDGSRPAGHPESFLLDDLVRALSVYEGPSWRATEIELVQSRLGEGRSGGPLHEVVATVPLTG